MTEAPSSLSGTIPDRDAIRSELEATRTAFHELLRSVSSEEWKKSANPAWSVGQLMWHVAWGAGHAPQAVEACRKGKAMNPPTWILNPISTLITRVGARGATPESVDRKYASAHAAIVACLDGVQDEEWQKGVRAFGRYSTIESSFDRLREHFQEHEADILRALGRA